MGNWELVAAMFLKRKIKNWFVAAIPTAASRFLGVRGHNCDCDHISNDKVFGRL